MLNLNELNEKGYQIEDKAEFTTYTIYVLSNKLERIIIIEDLKTNTLIKYVKSS